MKKRKKNFTIILFTAIAAILLGLSYNPNIFADTIEDNVKKLEKELEKVPDREKSAIINKIAFEYCRRSKYKKAAMKYSRKALELARKFGDKKQEVIALANTGKAYWRFHNDAKAIELCNKSLRIAKKLGDKELALKPLNVLATVYDYMPDYKSLLKTMKEMKSIYDELGDKPKVALYTHGIGSCYYQLGKNDIAIKNFKKALNLYKELGDLEHVVQMLCYLGAFSSIYDNNDQKAMEYYTEAREIAEENNLDKMAARAYNAIGDIYKKQKDNAKALEYYSKAFEIQKKTGHRPGLRNSYYTLGEMYKLEKKYDKALEYMEMSLKYQRQIRSTEKGGTADIFVQIGNIYFEKGDFSKALGFYNKALKIALRYNEYEEASRSYLGIGELFMARGKLKNAQSYFKKSLKFAKMIVIEANRRNLLKKNYKFLAELYSIIKKPRKAKVYYILFSSIN